MAFLRNLFYSHYSCYGGNGGSKYEIVVAAGPKTRYSLLHTNREISVSTHDLLRFGRRDFLLAAGAASLSLAFPLPACAASRKIGMIGSGRVGSTIGELWVKAGHEVMFSSLDLKHDQALAAKYGRGAKAGTPLEAATFGEVLFFSVPYTALPALGRELAVPIKGKIALDASNPIPTRDGEMAVAAGAKGSGIASAEFLPGTRLVRAFNCVGWTVMLKEAHRAGEKLGIPIAADDQLALMTGIALVQEAGFEPVVVGGLARAKDFDYGTPIFGKGLTAAQVRETLGIKS